MDTNKKQTILQILMTKPFLKSQNFVDFLRQYGIDNKDEFVSEANDLLGQLGLTLRNIISDYNDEEYYGICQTYEDPNAKESLGLKPEVVQLFYRFLENVIQSMAHYESSIPYGSVIDLAPSGMSQLSAQEAINQLKDMGYLDVVEEKVRIGPRGLLEFKPKFTKCSNDDDGTLPQCVICLDYILAGKKCPRCNCFLHHRCYERCRNGRDSFLCPTCQTSEEFVDFGM